MAMKLVCDRCQNVVESGAFNVVQDNGEFTLTADGIHLHGDFRARRVGKGAKRRTCA